MRVRGLRANWRIPIVLLISMLLFGLLAAAKPVSDPKMTVLSNYDVEGGLTEIIAVAGNPNRLLVSQSADMRIALLDIQDPSNVKPVATFDTSAWGEPTSVAANGNLILVAVKDDPNPGVVLGLTANSLELIHEIPVGIGPDSIAISQSGRFAVVTIEDEETELSSPYSCPVGNVRPGSVAVIALRGMAGYSVRDVALDLTGIPGVNCASDPQPEAVALDGDRFAYVTLQENNAIAKIDIQSAGVVWIRSAGLTSHKAYAGPTASYSYRDFVGRREPDGIALAGKGSYLVTADEGDTSRVTVNGVVEFSGGRTITIFSAADGSVISDSGSQIDDAVFASGFYPLDRTNNRGPEPEMVTVFNLQGREYAAVTLERAGLVHLFDITDPRAIRSVGLAVADQRPEGILYIQGRQLLVVANEVGGTITIIQVGK